MANDNAGEGSSRGFTGNYGTGFAGLGSNSQMPGSFGHTSNLGGAANLSGGLGNSGTASSNTNPPLNLNLNTQNDPFTIAQHAELAALMVLAMVSVSGTVKPPQFRARDVGYFKPDSSKPPVTTRDNHQIYYNVYSFT